MKKRLLFAVLAASMMLAAPVASDDARYGPRGQLVSEIDYWFVGDRGEWDDEGRLLVWEATISGDVVGEMKWWFVIPSPVSDFEFVGGSAGYYSARWEIWVGDELLLAGESAGKTVFPDGEDGVWDGHGVITEAGRGLNRLKGRKISETGIVVVGSDPPFSYSGEGMFQIY